MPHARIVRGAKSEAESFGLITDRRLLITRFTCRR
jgi:hypothetical protein